MNRGLEALAAVPNVCLLAWGWRRRTLTFVAGAASALALPPYSYTIVLLVTLPCLVWLMDGAIEVNIRALRRRFWTGFSIGWWFGFGYFLAGLWWIGGAFLVEADRFAWMIPFAVLAMPAGLALFYGLGMAFAALLWSDRGTRIVALALFLSLADWLRGHILTGFPWNAFGYALSDSLMFSQTASLVGVYGLGFLILLIFSAPAVVIDNRGKTSRYLQVGAACALLAAMALFGSLRLYLAGPAVFTETDIRIVQPAIAQSEKWRPENRGVIFGGLLELTQRPLGGSARVGHQRYVIWPESAVPFLLTREPGALVRISQALDPSAALITGAVRYEQIGDEGDYYNSVYLISQDGAVADVYDKVRLVPFGEYLPLHDVLQRLGLEKLVDAPGAFSAGTRHRVISPQAGASFLPLICYEAIFSGIAASAERPEYLLNVTNDAWFGDTPGPYQHFAQARMRAIEQGLPLVRAANTGISAVIDSRGAVLERLPFNEKGVIDGRLPVKLSPTVYARFGDGVFFLFAILSGFLLFGLGYNRDSRKN